MSVAVSDHPILVHPTDYGADGRLAFVHAVRLGLRGHYAVSLLNIEKGGLAPRHSGVRDAIDLLAQWRMLPAGGVGAASLERDLGFSVIACAIPADDVRSGVIDYLDSHHCDLVVIATRKHRGLSRWLERSLADRAQRRGHTLALLMGEGARGFVNPSDGAIRLQRILVPVDDRIDLEPALQQIEDFVDRLGLSVELRLLHVGARNAALRLSPGGRGLNILYRDGPVADTILETARRISADLIAMPTAKRSGVIAALRGSVTAQILDDGRWPVLSVPTG